MRALTLLTGPQLAACTVSFFTFSLFSESIYFYLLNTNVFSLLGDALRFVSLALPG